MLASHLPTPNLYAKAHLAVSFLLASCLRPTAAASPPVAPGTDVGVSGLPHEDVDLYLVPCNASDADMLWKLAPAPTAPFMQLQLTSVDPVDHDEICLNCPTDRCHGWPCKQKDRNSMFKVVPAADGNITLLSAGGGQSGSPAGLCLSSLTGGIGSKIEFEDCANAKNRENLWHLSTDGLLHNRAVQASQSFDLCLQLDTSGATPKVPPVHVAGLTIDGSKTSPLPHFWSACVGSSHGAMWLRADWNKHLKMAHEMGGFHYVRGHGMLDEDVQCYSTGQSYYNAIRAYSNVLEAGMKPLVELSFTPNPLVAKSATGKAFHYAGDNTPPVDMALYEQYIYDFVKALVDYFGVEEVNTWAFEVYNEPDLSQLGCKSTGLTTNATDPECKYFEMFAACSRAIKNVSQTLKVGGPATSQGRWLVDLGDYCAANDIALDFLSTHSYPNDPADGRPGWGPNGHQADTPHQLMAMEFASKQAKEMKKPLYITEWSSDPGSRSPYHDTTDTAAYIISTVASVRHLNLTTYSYWTFSDVFEEGGIPGKNTPFHGGFGMINLWDMPKPSMWAFNMLNMLSDTEVAVSLTDAPAIPSLTTLASVVSGVNCTVILSNHLAVGLPDPPAITVGKLHASSLGFTPKTAKIARIDKNHTNPHAAWLTMGSPNYPTPAQQKVLLAAAEMEWGPLALDAAVTIPPHGTVAIVLEA